MIESNYLINQIQMRKMIYIFLGLAFSAASAYCFYKQSDEAGKETESRLNAIITQKSDENKKLSETILNLSRNINSDTKAIAGTGSYPIAFHAGLLTKETAQISISLHGEYAIPKLTVKIVTISNYRNISGLNLRVLGIDKPIQDLGTLKSRFFKNLDIKVANETAILLYFSSDNNSWNQSIRLIRTKRGVEYLSIIQDKEGKFIFKQKTDHFPLTKDGKVVLWSNEVKFFDEI